MRKEDTRGTKALYNAVPIDSLNDLKPNFAWEESLTEAGAKDKLEYLVVPQLDYSNNLDNIIQSTDIDTCKTYFKWPVVDHTAGRLSEHFDDQNFDFYGKTLRGVKE
ncbi:MAG: putative endopeptidase [Halioglobus sp.]|jgi:putative endopeptidase